MSGLKTYRIARKKKKEVPIITFNQSFQSPNQSGRRSKIDSIIVHHTAGLFPGCAMWLCDLKARASAHVIITTDGVMYKLISEHRRAWHAGRGAFDANKDGVISYAEKYWNDHSIGIELEAVDPYNYTSAQLDALDRLVYYYVYQYPTILTKQILGHKEIAPDRKIDPANFDMDEFRKKIKFWMNL
jgi:N-acetyl-anhydromuramyl-L-alanine amidase AmpD